MQSRWSIALSVCALGSVLVLAGCQDSGGDQAAAGVDAEPAPVVREVVPTPVRTGSAAKVKISPSDGKNKVRLDKVITVTSVGAPLTEVTARDEDDKKLPGTLSADGTTWTADASSLEAAATYRVEASSVDGNGITAVATSTFTTLKPAEWGSAYLTPGDDWTVGVGMPIVVTLSKSVSDENRDAVEEAISVSTKPKVSGGWRWFSDSQLQWRPKRFWESGTKVTVSADLDGVKFRDGVWGEGSDTNTFRVGSEMISTVDMANHTMTVRRDGQVLRTIPITTGKSGFETRVGTKVIMSRESSRQMNSETTGIGRDSDEYYNVNVKWAMRLTYSGEFLHAAPWSVGSQGHTNVSHGCTGMSTANAEWLYANSKVGDVVKYVNGSRSMEWGNGYTAWNKTFKEWATGA